MPYKERCETGLRLSPLLFNIYTEYVMRLVLDDWEGGATIGGRKISNLRFADDTTLIAQNEEELVILLQKLKEISEDHGLQVNYRKTKIMIIDRANDNWPNIRTIANCEVVQEFVYLGSLISNNGGCEKEIKRRI